MDQETGLCPHELLEAQSHAWNHTFNIINSAALNCAVELAIPDIINRHGKSMTAAELASALHIAPHKTTYLRRLMRLLTHNGFFATDGQEEGEAYSLTNASKILLRDHKFSVAPFTQHLMTSGIMTPLVQLSDWFQKSTDEEVNPFQMVHGGRPFWDYGAGDAKRGRTMEELMANDSRLVASVLLQEYRWVFEGVNTLVEIGGRIGIVGSAVAEAFPEMEVTVLDLPDVVAGFVGRKNFKYVGGDMFEEIPPADAIFFKWVFIDCLDEAALKTLKRCREAISKNGKGKVILVEEVLKSEKTTKAEDQELMETLLQLDFLEMTTIFGKLRSEKEWAKLFTDAGFSNYKITQISSLRTLIEVFP